MAEIPEPISDRLAEIESKLAELRAQQIADADRYAAAFHRATALRAALNARKEAIGELKRQRKTLRFAVDAIEGRIISVGSISTEPFIVRGVMIGESTRRAEVINHAPQPETGPPTVSSQRPKPQQPMKDQVLNVLRRSRRAMSASEIGAAIEKRGQAVGPVLSRLAKDRQVRNIGGGSWEARG